jgi:predicted ATPase
LCTQLGETPHLFPVLRGLWILYTIRAQLRAASQFADQLLAFAQDEPGGARLPEAHYVMGMTLFNAGELTKSQAHFERSIRLYDPEKHSANDLVYGQSTRACCLVDLSMILWLRGYPERAVTKIREALSLARLLDHPSTLAMVFDWAAYLYWFRREGESARESAEAAIALSGERGFPLWANVGSLLRGWAIAQSDPQTGIAEMRTTLVGAREIGLRVYWPAYLCMLAEVHERTQNLAEARALLAEAFAAVEQTGETSHLAELYRMRGRLCLAPDSFLPELEREAEAESCFRQAIEVARRQDAKSLELRATTDLARLLAKRGKWEEARRVLSELYSWFTEGFDTADLKDAKALMEQLTSGR